jgi:phosphoglycolate phosphatase-like HAD superfamily hydrolase
MYAPPEKLRIAFDFDHTLIDLNSDLLPFQSPDALPYGTKLFPDFGIFVKRLGPGSWTRTMRLQLAALSRQKGYSSEALRRVMINEKMEEVLVQALRNLAGWRIRGPRNEAEADVEMIIVSDANDVFINDILHGNDLDQNTFQAIYTNKASWTNQPLSDEDEALLSNAKSYLSPEEEDTLQTLRSPNGDLKSGTGTPISDPSDRHIPSAAADVSDEPRLDVEPYTPPTSPHNCPRCAANMCKSAILAQAWTQPSDNGDTTKGVDVRTVYVGDGHNDYCPALSLKPTDLLLVREGYALWKMLKRHEAEDSDDAAKQDQAKAGSTSGNAGEAAINGTIEQQEHASPSPSPARPKERVVAEVKSWRTQAELGRLLMELTGDTQEVGIDGLTEDLKKRACL